MLFNSLEFLIFFPAVVIIYFLIPHRFRWVFLLLSSYYFYMAWRPEYIVLILISTIVDYFACIWMGKEKEKKKRKKFLYLSLICNLGLLFVFKYFNFFNDSIRTVVTGFNMEYGIPDFSLLLPMGISFYTFQTLSYTIDVYRGRRQPEKHFGIFALYVSFFPQLVAGPIERSDRLMPQFFEKKSFDFDRVSMGLQRMAWGFFKKVVIADRLAIVVNNVYGNPGQYDGISYIAVMFLFSFQIFCDFSGYSDIAIGAAKVMGFDLMENFKRPFFAKSISDFWRRWHISLSSWFKDYLYIPLGGNRVSVPRNYLNLFITFLISGLWHGANWGFVVWGALHGVWLMIEKATIGIRAKTNRLLRLEKVPFIHKVLQVGFTFFLVSFAFVFFRAESLPLAWYMIKGIFTIDASMLGFSGIANSIGGMGLGKVEMILAVLSIFILEIAHISERKKPLFDVLSEKPLVLKWTFMYVILMTILLFGVFDNASEFIYFQF